MKRLKNLVYLLIFAMLLTAFPIQVHGRTIYNITLSPSASIIHPGDIFDISISVSPEYNGHVSWTRTAYGANLRYPSDSSVTVAVAADAWEGYAFDIVAALDNGQAAVISFICVANHTHIYDSIVIQSATCTEKGTRRYTCKECPETYDAQDMEALGHQFSAEMDGTLVSAANCQSPATYYDKCTRCGADGITTHSKGTTTMHNWDNGTITVQPTCTADGNKEFTCTICNATKNETIAASGHVSVSADNAIAPGCEEKGKTEGRHCSVCNIILVAQQDVEALGHKYDEGKVITEPTTEAEGKRIFTCEVCGKTRTETIDKLPVTVTDGLAKAEDGSFLYYENGRVATEKFGFAEVDGIKFLIVNGKYESSVNGLYNDPENPDDWYYCAEGRAQTQYSGLCSYDGAWFYVKDGKMDTKTAGFVEYDGGLFYVGVGRIMTEVNGLAQDPATNAWYFLANGQVQTQYTGLAMYDNAWFYIVNGMLR